MIQFTYFWYLLGDSNMVSYWQEMQYCHFWVKNLRKKCSKNIPILLSTAYINKNNDDKSKKSDFVNEGGYD